MVKDQLLKNLEYSISVLKTGAIIFNQTFPIVYEKLKIITLKPSFNIFRMEKRSENRMKLN